MDELMLDRNPGTSKGHRPHRTPNEQRFIVTINHVLDR
jgi:hypothetical protein